MLICRVVGADGTRGPFATRRSHVSEQKSLNMGIDILRFLDWMAGPLTYADARLPQLPGSPQQVSDLVNKRQPGHLQTPAGNDHRRPAARAQLTTAIGAFSLLARTKSSVLRTSTYGIEAVTSASRHPPALCGCPVGDLVSPPGSLNSSQVALPQTAFRQDESFFSATKHSQQSLQ